MSDERDKGGRPTKYDIEFCNVAHAMAASGATDLEIADVLKVSTVTIWRWKAEHPEFCKAIQLGKDSADDRVEASLYHRAIGYSHDAVKIFMPANAPAPVVAEYREHYPPDTAAASLWLRNRRPDKWRDKVTQTFETGDGQPLVPVLNVIERTHDQSGTAPKAVNGAKLNGH